MPTYEYACRDCGHAFEEIHKISDPPIATCPKCGKDTAQRLISQGNFILKGSGWYVTGGYGTSGSKSESSSSSSAGSASASASSTGKSESSSTTTTPASTTPAAPAAPSTPSSGSGTSTS